MDDCLTPLQEKNMNSSAPKKSNKRLSVERIYQKKTQLEHILLRPDAYIGSVEPTQQPMWVWDDANKCMVNREVNFVPGLYKIFDEILGFEHIDESNETSENLNEDKCTSCLSLEQKVEVLQNKNKRSETVMVEMEAENRAVIRQLEHELKQERQKNSNITNDLELTKRKCEQMQVEMTACSSTPDIQITASSVANTVQALITVNAADNKQRDHKMNFIKIVIDPESNLISVKNNGRGIPVEMHKEEKLYVPSMIFGHLLTSSNYDDTQKKVTGGRNGYGAKLCNIYSTEFTVETVCDGQHFKQTWKSNMGKTNEPKIQKSDVTDYTLIKYHPDLAKFKMEKLDRDTVALLTKRAYDMAGCIRGVSVYLNGTKLPVRSFKDYIQLYLKDASADSDDDDDEGERKIVYEVVNNRWEVAITVSHKGFQQASFVNSIATTKGGTHVNYVLDQIIDKLIGIIKRKSGKGSLAVKPFQIKNHLWVFINCLIENPAFDSQTKENMTLRAKAFGSECSLGDKFVKEVTQCGVVENILDWVKLKTQKQLKKNSGNKSSRLKGIPKLDDANDAGTKNAIDCTLILTEGDSAKTLAVSGLSVVGRDRYGVFPLRGKLLNVREASHKQLMENQEINNIVKIMGLQYGKKYRTMDDLRSLRYGRLMIMTDQDQDGSHIKGLLINFVHHNWPELLKLPFLEEFITPIVKASKGREEFSFYSIPEFDEWKASVANAKSWKIKYYKGLGTSTPKEAKEYFADMERHRILFDYSGITDDEAIALAFSKKKINERKQWLTTQLEERKTRREAGLPEIYLYGPGTKRITYTDFVNKELILFSNADNERSIPSLVDGLKPGQRKVLFTCFKRNDKRDVKVAQLSGSVAELSAYHHGEQSLAMAIVGLAQNFVGSNNLNLLMPIGQFGTRIHGGKDSASSRYIFTKLSSLARLVFPAHDDNVLNFLVEDNQVIEPEWYCPIIPMVLVNGADGIGTGYSTKIPNFDVRQLVQYIKDLLEDKEPERLAPSYKNFTGEIKPLNDQRFEVFGKVDVIDEKTIDIIELPVGTWTQNYKESVLEVMLHGTEKYKACIGDYKEYHTDITVHFSVTMTEEELMAAENIGLHKKFNLTSAINTTNMVLFDSYGAIKKYNNVAEIIREFYGIRLDMYVKRKEFLEGMLTAEAQRLTNQARFILEKIDGVIVIENKAKRDVVMKLVERGFTSDPVKAWKELQKSNNVVAEETDDSRSEASSTGSGAGPDFSYLLSMALLSLSKEKKEELLKQRDDKKAQLDTLRQKTPKNLWSQDLEAFLEELEIVEAQEREDAEAGAKIANKNKSGRSKQSARSRKGTSKNTIEKAIRKQAKPKEAIKAKNDEKAKETKESWGFSDDSENGDMLSLSERLALKKYVDNSDVSSISSISSMSKSNKASSKKPTQIDSDVSEGASSSSKSKSTSKKASKAPAKRGKKTEPVNTIEQAFKAQAKPAKKKTDVNLEDIEEISSDESMSSRSSKKVASKRVEVDSDSSASSLSVEVKSSKPPAKKAKLSKPAAAPKRKKITVSSSSEDEDGGGPVSPVKRPSRRQKPAAKYVVDDNEEDDDDDDSKGDADDWMDEDDDDDSDFE